MRPAAQIGRDDSVTPMRLNTVPERCWRRRTIAHHAGSAVQLETKMPTSPIVARAILAAFALVPLLVAFGCPSSTEPLVTDRCIKHGEKCRTAAGPLGVCDSIPCPDGESGPCFKCMPQH